MRNGNDEGAAAAAGASADEPRPATEMKAALTAPTKSWRTAAFVFVFITVLLDMLALGMIIPVLPKLVVDFLGGDTAHGAEIFGAVRHRLGADAVRVLAGAGRAVRPLRPPSGDPDVEFRARPRLHPDGARADAGWLFVGRVISGITAASISTSYAYIADVTPPEQRAARFGMLGVAFGAGFVFGPGARRPGRQRSRRACRSGSPRA